MCKSTRLPIRQQVARSLRFTPAHDDHAALLTLTVDGQDMTYTVEELPCEDGEAGFRLTKLDLGDEMPNYDVRVTGAFITCDCPGGTYRDTCRHVDAIRELILRGQLKGAKARQHICTSFDEWQAA